MARLVVKGFLQGIVDDSYAPVSDFTTVRTFSAVGVQKQYFIEQLDVKTAFLHGELDTEVYVHPPSGTSICSDDKVLLLKKGLYGLKQSPRLWYQKWCQVMQELKFETCKADERLFFRTEGNEKAWILRYVHDIILMGDSHPFLTLLKTELSQHLDIKDLGT